MFARSTVTKMAQANKQGYKIIAGNSPKSSKTKYGSSNFRKLAQTNSRKHGKSIRTVYAIK